MEYRSVKCDSLLNRITKKDQFFLGKYTLDPYQNCEFGCKYCDSASDEKIFIKNNLTEIFRKELDNLEKGTIIIGSVVDPYQKAEKKYENTRNLLRIIQQKEFSCHILTKSNLILRDADILSKLEKPMVTISIPTIDESLSDTFEKRVPAPIQRLQIVRKLSEKKINTGVAVIPILPYLVEEKLEETVKLAKDHKANYVLYKHLELKGDQKNIFMKILDEFYPDFVEEYEQLYKNSYLPNEEYISKIAINMSRYCKKYSIKNKIEKTKKDLINS